MTVAQLNRLVAGLIERGLPPLRVVGELSNVTRAASGHWYFTLKDGGAQVRAVMFRGRAQYVDFAPREGLRVEVRALATLYEARGEFQLTVEAMRRAGEGDLYQRFLQLRDRLQREGLFDPDRKRPLPASPRAIGVVTSAQAAALRDVLTTLRRRAPQIPVVLYPSPVQGADAPAGLVAALRAAARRGECDVVLLVRGGGSIEDLWAFNDETLARTIAQMPVPVVSGVGHETDFTIADFVADLRAPTPTAAAAAASPDRTELLARLQGWARQLARSGRRMLQQHEQRLDGAVRLLRPPSAQWRQRAMRLEHLAQRLRAAGGLAPRGAAQRLARVAPRLQVPAVAPRRLALDAMGARLARAGALSLERAAGRTDQAATRLALASPQQLLSRGYAIVRDEAGRVVRTAGDTAPGRALNVLLGAGELDVRVEAARGPAPGEAAAAGVDAGADPQAGARRQATAARTSPGVPDAGAPSPTGAPDLS